MKKTQTGSTVQLVRPARPPAPRPYVEITHQTGGVVARQTSPGRFDLQVSDFGGRCGSYSQIALINVSLDELRDLLAGCEVLAHEARESA